jgi:hypothetical protein
MINVSILRFHVAILGSNAFASSTAQATAAGGHRGQATGAGKFIVN